MERAKSPLRSKEPAVTLSVLKLETCFHRLQRPSAKWSRFIPRVASRFGLGTCRLSEHGWGTKSLRSQAIPSQADITLCPNGLHSIGLHVLRSGDVGLVLGASRDGVRSRKQRTGCISFSFEATDFPRPPLESYERGEEENGGAHWNRVIFGQLRDLGLSAQVSRR